MISKELDYQDGGLWVATISKQGWANFLCEGPTVNILGFVHRMVFVGITHPATTVWKQESTISK